MTNPHNKGNGRGIRFLRDRVNFPGDECLIWPMFRNPNGYGQFSVDGVLGWTHRFMCKLAHGEPPTPEHEAAHSCGKGHEGCVNPRHLSWKTISENIKDRKRHGTKPDHNWRFAGRLEREQVDEIRSLKGKETQVSIAARFGISAPTVRDIQLGRTHRADAKVNGFTVGDDDILREGYGRGDGITVISERLKRSHGSVRARIYRLGLRGSKYVGQEICGTPGQEL